MKPEDDGRGEPEGEGFYDLQTHRVWVEDDLSQGYYWEEKEYDQATIDAIDNIIAKLTTNPGVQNQPKAANAPEGKSKTRR